MFASEQDLYEPVKIFLAARGWEAKGEVGNCDILARREGEAPLVVELKLRFTLSLVLQGVDRLALTDTVYLGACVGNRV